MTFGNVLIFGDSYSTYAGYIPQGYAAYYSGKRTAQPDLDDVSKTWWQRLITETGSHLVQNNSWSGSTICYTGYNGDCSATSSFICRLNKMADEGFFRTTRIDTVFVFGGTNDSWANAPLGELQYDAWKKEDLYSVLPAICHFLSRLKEELPEANIICLVNTGLKPQIAEGFSDACARYGIRRVAFESIDKINNHPTEQGMIDITTQILAQLSE